MEDHDAFVSVLTLKDKQHIVYIQMMNRIFSSPSKDEMVVHLIMDTYNYDTYTNVNKKTVAINCSESMLERSLVGYSTFARNEHKKDFLKRLAKLDKNMGILYCYMKRILCAKRCVKQWIEITLRPSDGYKPGGQTYQRVCRNFHSAFL
jgi:hypothetical protein